MIHIVFQNDKAKEENGGIDIETTDSEVSTTDEIVMCCHTLQIF